MAIAVAVSVAAGAVVIEGLDPLLTGPVVYLDWETNAETVDRVVKAIAAGAGLGRQELIYIACRRPLTEMVEEVARLIANESAVLAVCDSVGLAVGVGDRGDPAERVIAYFNALGSLGVTTLSVDHVAKAGSNGMPIGSVYKTNAARARWEQTRIRNDEQVLRAHLDHRKHNVTSRFEPIALAIEWLDDGARASCSLVRRDRSARRAAIHTPTSSFAPSPVQTSASVFVTSGHGPDWTGARSVSPSRATSDSRDCLAAGT